MSKRKDTTFFFNPPKGESATTDEGRKYERNAKQKAHAAWEIHGWRSYYQIIIHNRWFEKSGRQMPFESAFYSPFLDAAIFISQLNSKN